jgi:hypothetical protein
LIEASEFVPSWINPENEENRVWINSGKIFLLPVRSYPEVKSTSGFEICSNLLKKEFYSGNNFQKIIEERINFKMTDMTHTTNVFIPKV